MVKVTPISPLTLEPQTFDQQDLALLTPVVTSSLFNPATDVIEYFIYDLSNNLLLENYRFSSYTTINDPKLVNSIPPVPQSVSGSSLDAFTDPRQSLVSTISVDPQNDVQRAGYTFGVVKTVYNFFTLELGSSEFNNYYISEISPDRTEIRLKSNALPSDVIAINFEEFQAKRGTGEYFDEFYLNFGENRYVLAVNILLDNTDPANNSLLIKLYEPLPPQYSTKSSCWVVTQNANSIAYSIDLGNNFILPFTSSQIGPPNYNIELNSVINNSTIYKDYDDIFNTDVSSSLYQVLTLISASSVYLNVDYTNYDNFVFFSSAEERLFNFRLKLLNISASQAQLYNLVVDITGSASSSLAISQSKVILNQQIQEEITSFDGYEYYLYYESGSKTWPKSNSTPPYVLYDVNSATANNWYITQSITASNYDQNNQNNLYYTIPDYIRSDSQNLKYVTFVSMVGQLFDQIWLYTKSITDKQDSSPGLSLGVSKELVAQQLESLGVKLYSSNFTNENIYNTLIGLNPSGGLDLPTGNALITNYVTSSYSASLVPTIDDYNKLIYKRIYHALPYLIKTKGTLNGLQTLLNVFGVPNTELRINEFGGKDKNINTFDNWEEEFSYAYVTTGSSKILIPFTASSSPYGTVYPKALEFRFRTFGLPTSSIPYSQSIINHSTNNFNIVLEYTGLGYTSGSYTGSIKDTYYQYATLKFITGSQSASVYLPFYDGGWWSVLVNATSGSTTNYELFAKNTIYSGSNGNTITYQASSSFTGTTFWNTAGQLFFGTQSVANGKTYTALSGSYQEIRYYNIPLSESAFNAFVMNPNSIEGNTAEGTQSSKNSLFFRLSLGGELYTGSTSIHPGITGSTPVSSSFSGAPSTGSFSGSYSWGNNYQYIFFDQFAVGIQNAISQKIRNQEIILPYTSSTQSNIPNNKVLSTYISVQQFPAISASYTPDVNYLEVGLSPQNEINEDINATLGYLNIGEYIGDPRLITSSADSYPALDALRDLYFEKYESNYDWNDFLRLIAQYDNSLFKMMKDFVPARSALASGIIIKQTILERNKYPVPQVNTETTASFQMQNQPFVFQNLEISGSPIQDIVTVTGSNGGSMPNLLGVTQSIGYYSPITQVWSGTTDANSKVGPVAFTQSSQIEFYDGELSGSILTVTTQSLNPDNPFLQVPTTLVAYTASISASLFVTYDSFLSSTPSNGKIFLFFDSSSII